MEIDFGQQKETSELKFSAKSLNTMEDFNYNVFIETESTFKTLKFSKIEHINRQS